MNVGYLTTRGDTADLQSSAATKLAQLTAHAALTLDAAHGGLSPHVQSTHDNAGHLIGRRIITALFNGVAINILADHNINGPTQPPKISPISNPNGYLKVGSQDVDNPVFIDFLQEDSDLATGTFPYNLEMNALFISGTLPIIFQWQFSLDNSTWTNFSANHLFIDSGTPNYSFGGGTFQFAFFQNFSGTTGTLGHVANGSGSYSGTLTEVGLVKCVFIPALNDPTTRGVTADPMVYVRLILSNSGMTDVDVVPYGLSSEVIAAATLEDGESLIVGPVRIAMTQTSNPPP